MMSDIDVSHIVTVYNKQVCLPEMVRSLVTQETELRREFIFVDDCSPDQSIAVLQACTKDTPNVSIIANKDNKGPSARLNQGARLAKGRYLHFLDHDDVVPVNAVDHLYCALAQTNADFIYGRWKRTNRERKDLLGTPIKQKPEVIVSDTPLATVLNGSFVRMCTMVKKETFMRANGCDERIFIQDESLPLRLAYAAKRFAITDAVVNLVPKPDGNLSDNKSQLNHDRFLAHYYMLRDHLNDLPTQLQLKLYQDAISSVWKEKRTKSKAFIWRYLASKYTTKPRHDALHELSLYFASLTNIRRCS